MEPMERKRSGVRSPEALPNLWRFYDEHAAQARQHENLRSAVAGTFVALAGVIVSLAGVGGLTASDAFAGGAVVLVGVVGAVLSAKHYERNRFHTRVLGVVRREIEALTDDPQLGHLHPSQLRDIAEKKHVADFALRGTRDEGSLLVRMSLGRLWVVLNLLLSLIGVVVVALAVLGVEAD